MLGFLCVLEIWTQLLQIALQGHYWVSLSTKVSSQPRNLYVWWGRVAWCVCPSSRCAPEWDYNAICIHCRAALFTWVIYIFVNSIFLKSATCPPRSHESALLGNNATLWVCYSMTHIQGQSHLWWCISRLREWHTQLHAIVTCFRSGVRNHTTRWVRELLHSPLAWWDENLTLRLWSCSVEKVFAVYVWGLVFGSRNPR